MSQVRDTWILLAKKYKCHVGLGSYNKAGEHAKEQGKGAEESGRAGAQGSRGKVRSRQGNRARKQDRGCRTGSRAGQQSKFNLQTAAEGRTFVKKYFDFLMSL